MLCKKNVLSVMVMGHPNALFLGYVRSVPPDKLLGSFKLGYLTELQYICTMITSCHASWGKAYESQHAPTSGAKGMGRLMYSTPSACEGCTNIQCLVLRPLYTFPLFVCTYPIFQTSWHRETSGLCLPGSMHLSIPKLEDAVSSSALLGFLQ